MSFWTAIVCIVAIFAVASVLRARARGQAGITSDNAGNETLNRPSNDGSDERDAAAQEEIRALKERIATLERIATDANSTGARESASLASEIEALRGPKADAD
jgi:hypothetical protein